MGTRPRNFVFEAVVSKRKVQAETVPSTATQTERRAWVRYPCNCDSACHPLAGAPGMQWLGKICNLSQGGVGLSVTRRFEVGTVLAIDMEGKPEHVLGTVLARVVHVSLQSDGDWLHGCAFTR